MKKFLLLSALAMGAFAAQADTYSDYYKVVYDGQEIENGATIYCTNNSNAPDSGFYDAKLGNSYETHIVYANQLSEELNLFTSLGCTNRPTFEDFQAHQFDTIGDNYYSAYGIAVNACYSTTIGGMGSCVLSSPGVSSVVVNPAFNQEFNWQVHCMMIDPTSVVVYTLTTQACTGNDAATAIPGTEFTVNIAFGPSTAAIDEALAGVNDIAVDEEAPVYFNLNGVQVNNPSKGIYVVKRGAKVTKEVIR